MTTQQMRWLVHTLSTPASYKTRGQLIPGLSLFAFCLTFSCRTEAWILCRWIFHGKEPAVKISQPVSKLHTEKTDSKLHKEPLPLIAQFRYIIIQLKSIDITTRLRGKILGFIWVFFPKPRNDASRLNCNVLKFGLFEKKIKLFSQSILLEY